MKTQRTSVKKWLTFYGSPYIIKIYQRTSVVNSKGGMKMPYENLIAAMKLKKVTYEQIANLLDVRLGTVADNVVGKTKCGISVNDAIQIKRVFFPEYDFEWLFTRKENAA